MLLKPINCTYQAFYFFLTEFAQDTPDTSNHSNDSSSDDDISVRLEYEVASTTEEENPMFDGTSSSDPEVNFSFRFLFNTNYLNFHYPYVN